MSNDNENNDDPGEPTLPMTVDSPIFWAEELVDREVLKAYYKEHGIRCLDCCAAEAETFAEGARVHEGGTFGTFDPEKVVADLNKLAEEHPMDAEKYRRKPLLERIVGLLFPSEKGE